MANNHGDKDRSSNAPFQEMLNLIWDLSEGVISDSDQLRLNSLLLESAEHRSTYTQFMHLIALLEHDHDQTVPIDINDARSTIDTSSSPLPRNSLNRAGPASEPVRRQSTAHRRSSSLVACVLFLVLGATVTISWFVPQDDRIVTQSEPKANSVQQREQNQLSQSKDDSLSPANNPLLQEQLDELAQMSSGGP